MKAIRIYIYDETVGSGLLYQCVRSQQKSVMSSSVTASSFICGQLLLEPIPAVSGRGQCTDWTSRQLIAGPSLMAEVAMQGASCTSAAIWGSVFLSKILWHAALGSRDSNQRPSDYQPTGWAAATLVTQKYELFKCYTTVTGFSMKSRSDIISCFVWDSRQVQWWYDSYHDWDMSRQDDPQASSHLMEEMINLTFCHTILINRALIQECNK